MVDNANVVSRMAVSLTGEVVSNQNPRELIKARGGLWFMSEEDGIGGNYLCLECLSRLSVSVVFEEYESHHPSRFLVTHHFDFANLLGHCMLHLA